MKQTNLIVGAGLSGIVLANKIATELQQDVTIIDYKDHIGGQCFDYKNEHGITIHKYGPHIFRTSDKKIWDFMSQFTDWHPYSHEVRAMVDGKEIPVPFNLNSLHACFEQEKANQIEKKLVAKFGMNVKIPILTLREEKDKLLAELADFIYNKVFLNYTLKQWGFKPEDLNPSVTASVPVYIGFDNRYFNDLYQGIPKLGYTKMFENMLDNPLITVKLNQKFEIEMLNKYSYIFHSGSIDEFCNYKYGKLPYRSLYFDFQSIDKPYFQRASVINYPNEHSYTRISEYKYFLNEISTSTTISYEYPQEFEIGKNERFYPILNDENTNLYKKYLDCIKQYKNLYFFGRLGAYKYYDMNRAIDGALNLFNSHKEKLGFI